LQMTSLSKGQEQYVETLFYSLLTKPVRKDGRDTIFEKPFESLAKMKELDTLHDGILLFLNSSTFLKDKKLGDEQSALVKQRMKRIKKILNQ
jgi:hypothetical protein